MSLGALIRDIHRRNTEWASGKILTYRSHWRWIDESDLPEEVKAAFEAGKTHFSDISPNATGNKFYRKMGDRVALLAKGASAHCPFPDLYSDAVPIQREDGAIVGRFVKGSDCKKCEHYRATKDSPERFPICALARQVRSNGESPKSAAAKATLGIYTSALKSTSSEINEQFT